MAVGVPRKPIPSDDSIIQALLTSMNVKLVAGVVIVFASWLLSFLVTWKFILVDTFHEGEFNNFVLVR